MNLPSARIDDKRYEIVNAYRRAICIAFEVDDIPGFDHAVTKSPPERLSRAH
jgi:hypothetical protein